MKKILFLAAIIISVVAFGQDKQKFGHINSNELLQMMPENQQAQQAIQTHAKELETQLVTMQAELEQKYNDYLAKKDSLSTLLQQTRESELNDLNTRIQSFQQTAQQDLQAKEGELLKPIYEKVQKAIKEVGEENGFIYIHDSASLLYFSKESNDVLPLVKKKLNIE